MKRLPSEVKFLVPLPFAIKTAVSLPISMPFLSLPLEINMEIERKKEGETNEQNSWRTSSIEHCRTESVTPVVQGPQILIGNSQAGSGRKTSQEQEDTSRNHVQVLFAGSVLLLPRGARDTLFSCSRRWTCRKFRIGLVMLGYVKHVNILRAC